MAKANARRNAGNFHDAARQYSQVSETFGEVKPSADPANTSRTARRIAYLLVGIMVFTIIGHYSISAVLGLMGEEVQTIELLAGIFDNWFPVITGFAGGAITYFLTNSD